MKYTVTYSCGHSGTVELFGPERDRERKLEWYQEHAVCPECYARQQTEERAAIESQYDLPALTGSDKQIAWAEKIRAGFLAERGQAETVKSNPNLPQDVFDRYYGQMQEFFGEFFGESSASAWIDRRNGKLGTYLRVWMSKQG